MRQPEVFQSNTQETAQTDGAQPVSIMIDGKWTEFPSVQEAEKPRLRNTAMRCAAIRLLSILPMTTSATVRLEKNLTETLRLSAC